MSKFKIIGLLSAWIIIYATNVHAWNDLDISHLNNTHTQNTLELKPISNFEKSYSLSSITFLPEYEENLKGYIKGDNIENCKGYTLDTCPSNGRCKKCTFANKYTLLSCSNGFNNSGQICIPNTCKTLNSSFSDEIPENKICTQITEFSLTCYKDCRFVSCSGYTLNCDTFNVKNSTGKETCSDCNSANANCSPKLCKVSSCQEGYKISAQNTTCVALDDNCPTNYYKTCETETMGNPTYTEMGTECYQCKPKDDGCDPIFKYTLEYCRTNFGKDYVATGNNGWCRGKFQECRKVAKILYGDGSIASVADWNKSKTPIGIVFDEANRMALSLTNITEEGSLEDKKAKWAANPISLYTEDIYSDENNRCTTTSGRENTTKLLNTLDGAPYEAAEIANDYEPVGCDSDFCSKGNWFLPSWEEWKIVKHQYQQILDATLMLYNYIDTPLWNKALQDIRGDNDSGYILYSSIWLAQDYIYFSNGKWNYEASTASLDPNELYKTTEMTYMHSIRPIIRY